jgi:hypothetical protein
MPRVVLVNENISLFVSAQTGASDPITYQWRKNGTPIVGATAASININSFQVSDVGTYSVLLTAGAFTLLSSDAILSIGSTSGSVAPQPTPPPTTLPFPAPTIATQPAAATVTLGSTATFTATVNLNGAPVMLYYWVKNGAPLSAGVSSSVGTVTLTLPNVQATDEADYALDVSTAGGAVRSAGARLALLQRPVIVTQPENLTVPQGSLRNFIAGVTGEPTPTLQWFRNNVALTGATSSVLTLSNIQPADAGDYTFIATNPAGSVTSQTGRLTVIATGLTLVSSSERAISAPVGGNASFSLSVSGPSPYVYVWSKSGVTLAGQSGPTLNLTNLQAADAGSYQVEVTNPPDTGRLISFYQLSVGTPTTVVPVVITGQPSSQSVLSGSTVNFTVTATGTPAPYYNWLKNGVAISGATAATLTLTNVGAADVADYTVLVSNTAGVLTSSVASLVLTPASAAIAPTITTQPASQSLALGSSASFTVVATGTVPLTYQWLKNGALIPGATAATLTLANLTAADAASYTATVTNSAGTVTSAAANLAVASAPSYAGTYFGRFNNNPGDRFALVIRPDGTAIFLGYAASLFTGYTATNITINADGSFTADLTELKPAAANTPAADPVPGLSFRSAPATALISLNGSVATGALTGGITGTALTVAAPKSPAVGAAQSAAGVYQTAALNSSTGGLTTIVDATGEAFVFSQTSTGVAAGTGTLNTTTGQVTAVLADSSQATTTLNTTSGSATATLTNTAKETLSFSGLAEGVVRTDRLVNIASRGAVSSSDLMIAGFVITGSSPKSVMIRATGPALAAFGVGGTVPNPKLELYRGTTKIQENDEWSLAANAADIIAAAARTGAFPLTAASADAVLLTTLEPGGYTAQVSSVTGAPGVALVEVYDAGSTPVTASTPRLVNISTRANVAGGEGLLIAGIVITGNSPKKILIRATGPALTAFGVPGALEDPLLKLYKGDTVIRQNDNWSESSSEAALITAAGSATGAFALTVGTKDAAMLITLEPGSYTAQVSGVAGATGAALVEVYEVP